MREMLLKTVLAELRLTLTPNGAVRLAGPIEAAEGAFGRAEEEMLGVLFRGVAYEYDTMIRRARQGPRVEQMRRVRGLLETAVVAAVCWRNNEAQRLAVCRLARAIVASGKAGGVPEVILLAEVDDQLRGSALVSAVDEMLAAAAALRESKPQL